jgi:hypothetical protein
VESNCLYRRPKSAVIATVCYASVQTLFTFAHIVALDSVANVLKKSPFAVSPVVRLLNL